MLLVACAIGLATGAGVVLFNDIIHAIRHLAWQVGCAARSHAGSSSPAEGAGHAVCLQHSGRN